MKSLAKSAIRNLVLHAPRGAQYAMLDACIESIGAEFVAPRVLQRLNITEVGAAGDRGTILSAWNDDTVLPEYGKTGTFAQTITSAFEKFFEAAGGTYMDVGANIGLTTIRIAQNQRVRCYAFEPEPINFGFLQRNVARNLTAGSVQIHQTAIFDRRGSLSLALADGNIGDHRIAGNAIAGRRNIEVPAAPLDDFLGEVVGNLGIKVDTQGAEPFVVTGGSNIFARAGMVAMEFCPYLINQLGGDPEVLVNFISSFEQVSVMSGGTAEMPHFRSPTEAQSIMRKKLLTAAKTDIDYLDILAVRSMQ